MSWFSRKGKAAASLEDAITDAKVAVSRHLHSLDVEVVEHVTEYRDASRSGRNDTWGHNDMRKWLQKLKDLRARLDHLERARALRSQIADHLGMSAAQLDMDGLLRLLHEADTHAGSEPEPAHG